MPAERLPALTARSMAGLAAATAIAVAALPGCNDAEDELPQAERALPMRDAYYNGGLEVDDLGVFWSYYNEIPLKRGVNVWYWEKWRQDITFPWHAPSGSITLMDDDATHLYLCSRGTVARAPKWEVPDNTGHTNVEREVLTEDDCWEIVVNGRHVYWVNRLLEEQPDSPYLAGRWRVDRYDTASGEIVTVLDTGSEGVGRLVFDAEGRKLYGSAAGGLSELPTEPGGSVRPISSFDDWPTEEWGWLGNELAVDDRYIYWTLLDKESVYAGEDMGAVFRAPLDGSGTWEIFAADQYYPRWATYHDGYVYWFVGRDLHSGRLMRQASDSTRAEIVAAGFVDGVNLEFWNGYAYWADFSHGWFHKARVAP